ncbi:MAG: PDZ domain-containing protein [Planctomycetes bacterium]|nr:PDZ domain-containing protein [Planctomycetota bacterium]
MDSSNILDQALLAAVEIPGWLKQAWSYVQIFAGFSFIIFIHELGHFAVAKWSGVRVEQFAIGFFREIVGFTKGETRYSFNLLPLGGYVKMLGQEDFEVDTTGELQYREDPRSFANKPVGIRMAIVSAGVIMNLVLSLVLFMIIFMVGKEVQSPRIGMVVPGRPAAEAGILSGDLVKSINGWTIDEFGDLMSVIMLAKPGKPLEFVIERDGEIKNFEIIPEIDSRFDLLKIGIGPERTADILVAGPGYEPDNPRHPRAGDTIVSMGGTEVTAKNGNAMIDSLWNDPIKFRTVVVERPIPGSKDGDKSERLTINLDPRILLNRLDTKTPTPHVLGMVPLMRFNEVAPGGRADLAGIEVGDVILKWGNIENPTPSQIRKSIVTSAKPGSRTPERDIPITLLKQSSGKTVNTAVRPKVKVFPIVGWHKGKPSIHAQYQVFADRLLRVGSIVDTMMGQETPAAKAGIPVNAVISKINEQSVSTWVDLAEALRTRAGEDVVVSYALNGEADLTATLSVPNCLRTKLGVGPASRIISIDGQERVKVKRNNVTATLVVNQLMAMHQILSDSVGKTVEVKYRPGTLEEVKTAQVEVTDDMLVPWVGSTIYNVDLFTDVESIELRRSNPFAAMKLGVKKTYFFVMQVYQTLERMIISRSLGVDKMSGPIGIVDIGSKVARLGFLELLWFLALISANLAVINFLPLPIVDGGLMVFLIIEKIKGSPISVRIQVATQVIGLALIAMAFLFVTLQDLAR